MINVFRTYGIEFVFFSGAGKFCLAHGLRQLTRDFKMSSKCSISEVTLRMRYHEKHRMTFEEGRYAT